MRTDQQQKWIAKAKAARVTALTCEAALGHTTDPAMRIVLILDAGLYWDDVDRYHEMAFGKEN